MIVRSEIRDLPLVEKMALLEAVWAELSSQPDQLEVPQWHREILDKRQRSVEEGKAVVLDWEKAGKQIGKQTANYAPPGFQ